MRLALLAAALAAGLVLGLAACGGDDETVTVTTTVQAATTTDDGEAETTTDEALTPGNSEAGQEVFISAGCGSCHVLGAAGSTGAVGPSLDDALVGNAADAGAELADYVRDSIEDPDEIVVEGYPAGTMPGDYDERLSDEELNDLVAFVVTSVQ